MLNRGLWERFRCWIGKHPAPPTNRVGIVCHACGGVVSRATRRARLEAIEAKLPPERRLRRVK